LVKSFAMKTYRLALAAFAAIVLSGCYSIEVASSTDFSNCQFASETGRIPTAHMLVRNDGWFLFNRIPIVCGNADIGSWLPWTFFNDEVSMDFVQRAIVRRAKDRGERIIQMNAINNSVTLMQLPSTQGLSIPYILCHHRTQMSVVFVRDPEEAAEEVAR